MLLVALWIGVYWWWPVGEDSAISVAPPEAAAAATPPKPRPPAPQPAPPPEVVSGPTPEPPAQPERTPVIIPPEFIDHVLKSGENYSSLSLRYYGTSAYATAISKANPLLSPTNLRAGRTIRVPKDPKNIQGIPIPQSTPPGAPQPAAMPTEYVVESGDTLSRIAATVYGDSTLTKLIFDANRDQLPNEHTLRIGQKLRIPPKPPQ